MVIAVAILPLAPLHIGVQQRFTSPEPLSVFAPRCSVPRMARALRSLYQERRGFLSVSAAPGRSPLRSGGRMLGACGRVFVFVVLVLTTSRAVGWLVLVDCALGARRHQNPFPLLAPPLFCPPTGTHGRQHHAPSPEKTKTPQQNKNQKQRTKPAPRSSTKREREAVRACRGTPDPENSGRGGNDPSPPTPSLYFQHW